MDDSYTTVSLNGLRPLSKLKEKLQGSRPLPLNAVLRVNIDCTVGLGRLEELQACLGREDSLFAGYRQVEFHLISKATYTSGLVDTLLSEMPLDAKSCFIVYEDADNSISICVQLWRSERRTKVLTGARAILPLDCDTQALGDIVGRKILSSITALEVSVPIADDSPKKVMHLLELCGNRLDEVKLAISPRSTPLILQHIAEKTVNLDVLHFMPGPEIPPDDIPDIMTSALDKFKGCFPEIVVDGTLFSWKLLHTLGKTYNIRRLAFKTPIVNGFLGEDIDTPEKKSFQTGQPIDPDSFHSNKLGRFKQLRRLELNTHLKFIHDMHALIAPMEQVTDFKLVVPELTEPMAATGIHACLAELFPSLAELELEFTRFNAEKQEKPDWVDIEGVTRHRGLTKLYIAHPFPLAVDDNTFRHILAEMPQLTRLRLNPSPTYVWAGTHLTARALMHTAFWNKTLVELGLYLGSVNPSSIRFRRPPSLRRVQDLPAASPPANHTLRSLEIGCLHGFGEDVMNAVKKAFPAAQVTSAVISNGEACGQLVDQ